MQHATHRALLTSFSLMRSLRPPMTARLGAAAGMAGRETEAVAFSAGSMCVLDASLRLLLLG
jgi:hypothetical protein